VPLIYFFIAIYCNVQKYLTFYSSSPKNSIRDAAIGGGTTMRRVVLRLEDDAGAVMERAAAACMHAYMAMVSFLLQGGERARIEWRLTNN
jgi:hypothetical protein